MLRAMEHVFSQSRLNYRQGRLSEVAGSPQSTTFYLQIAAFESGAEGIRTPDLRCAKAALSEAIAFIPW